MPKKQRTAAPTTPKQLDVSQMAPTDEFGVIAFGAVDVDALQARISSLATQLETERMQYESYIARLKGRIRELQAGAPNGVTVMTPLSNGAEG